MDNRSCKIKKIPSLQGNYKVPPDESILQRALFILAQAVGKSTISSFFAYDSVIHTIGCLEHLGISIKKSEDSSTLEIYGIGLRALSAPANVLNIGNSHIGAHLLLGAVAPYPFQTIITGTQYFNNEFKIKGIQHFSDIGVEITSPTLPTVVKGSDYCTPHEHELKHSCSQTKSALLMAGLNIMGTTTIVEPFSGSRDHTENVLKYLGVDIKVTRSKENTKTTIRGLKEIPAQNLTIPGDPSVALFLVAAATLIPESAIIINDVCLNEGRLGVYKLLQEMGAKLDLKVSGELLGEKVGEIHVRSSKLTGITVKESDIPMENFRILLFLLCTADGKSIIENPKGLKLIRSQKFTRFIETMQKLGAIIEVNKTQIEIKGTTLKGGKSLNALHDYYLSNLLILSGFISQESIIIRNYRPEWFLLYYNTETVPSDALQK